MNNKNKIVKTICNIIQTKIPKKIEKLEKKFGIGIHTCNFTQKVKLSNGVILSISINKYCDIEVNKGSMTDAYDIYFGENESTYVVKTYKTYNHDLEEDSEYFEILEKVCEIMNAKGKKESNGKSVSEILSKMK